MTKLKEELGVCDTDHEGRVVSQNPACLKSCGQRRGIICKDGCAALIARAVENEGAGALDRPMLFRSREVNDRLYDIVYAPGAEGSVRMLSPLGDSYSVKVEELKSFGLTAQEFRIASLMLKGLGNGEICEQLDISRSTIKAHINRIYRKLGEKQDLVGRARGR